MPQGALDALRGLGDGLQLVGRGDDRLGLDAGHVLGVCAGQEAIVILGQRNQDSFLDQLLLESFVLCHAAGHDVQVVRAAEADLVLCPGPHGQGQGHPVSMDDRDRCFHLESFSWDRSKCFPLVKVGSEIFVDDRHD